MPKLLPALPLAFLLAGCAGYASDYWKPKENLVAPQLARYGLAPEQAQCAGAKLTRSLTVWQLRQLADLAGRLVPGGQNPAALGTSDFLYVAGLVRDPKVGVETKRALESCHAGPPIRVAAAAPAPAAPVPTPPPAQIAVAAAVPVPPAAPAAPPHALPLWVNLGVAASGQAISVDAATLENAPGWRQGWFRLANPGEAGPGALSYRLRIDCVERAITATGGRKYGPTGAIMEQKDYPTPQGPLAIETGTVMEVAFHAMCS